MMNDIHFANPEFFYLLLLLPLMLLWYFLRLRRQSPALTFPGGEIFKTIKPTIRLRLRHILPLLRIAALALIIIALARPQSHSSKKSVTTEGVDIIIALDVSTSMLAEDFKPNRIEAAKKTAMQFIENRANDRIGLVVFAGESYTQCPVTIDHSVLKNLLGNIKSGTIQDGTTIGDGLATAVSRLKDSESKSRVIILLTDGVNNMGNISPITAAEIAETFGVRVYTIGVGTRGKAPYPQKFRNWMGQIVTQYVNVDVQIDEDVLKHIANTSGGKYFRATNNKALENIYNEIDRLEKVKIDVAYYSRYTEEFHFFAILAGIFLLTELLLKFTLFRTYP